MTEDQPVPAEPAIVYVQAPSSGPSATKIALGVFMGVLAAVAAIYFVTDFREEQKRSDCAIGAFDRALAGETDAECDRLLND